ncbi:MAG: hypothetical protein KIS92_23010 [Planctomycetota bacterium]|nr:hypothetical protein [Planctomycetota bacterium]
MAKKGGSLHIYANESAAATLADICHSSIHVSVHGTVTKEKGESVLVVNQVIAQPDGNLPIAASAATKAALIEAAETKEPTEVVINGRVVQGGDGRALVLDEVAKVSSLPIIASEAARSALAKLATNGAGEVTVKAKVAGKGVNRVLVLEASKK